MITNSQTKWSEEWSSENETQSTSSSHFNIENEYTVESFHSIRQHENTCYSQQHHCYNSNIGDSQRTIRKEVRFSILSDGEDELSLKNQDFKEAANKYIQNQTDSQTIEKRKRKQFQKQKSEQQENTFKEKKESSQVRKFSKTFKSIQKMLLLRGNEHSLFIINYLQKKDYIVSGFLNRGGEADILKGYYLNQLNEEEECVFRIIRYKTEDLAHINEEFEIMQLFKSSKHTVNLIERIVLEDINIIIEVIKKCKVSLKDEMCFYLKTNKNYTYRQLCYIISNLIDSLVELRLYEILHLDIKPENILRNQENIYVISDFGISSKSNKGSIEVKGYTKKYCPKEQIQGMVTHKSDIYSLGITIDKLIDFCISQDQILNQNDINKFTQTQINSLQDIKELIRKKMTKEDYQDREDCIELIFQYYEIIGKGNVLMQRYFKQKIRMIPYNLKYQDKDIKFIKLLELRYSILYLQIFVDQYKIGINVNDISDEKKAISISPIISSEINILKYLKQIASIGLMYYEIGQASKSRAIMKHCKSIFQLTKIENTLLCSQVIFLLGDLSIQSREDEDSLKLFKMCYQIVKTIFDSDHPYKAQIIMKIGFCYYYLAKPEKSIQIYTFCLEMYQRLFKDNSKEQQLEIVRVQMGKSYARLGDYKNAIYHCKKAYDMRKEIYKSEENYFLFPSNLVSMACCYDIIPDYKTALKYQQEVIETREKNSDGNFLYLGEANITMGNYKRQLNDTKGAHQSYMKAINIYQQNYQDSYHRSVATAYLYLGLNYQHRGQFQLSFICQMYSLWMKLKSYKNIFHPFIATSINTLGNIFFILGYLEEGLKLAKMAYFLNVKNKDRDIKALTNYRIGNAFLLIGDSKLALKFSNESLKLYQQIYSKSNCQNQMEIAKCLFNIGISNLRIGYLKEGYDYCLRSVKMHLYLYYNNIFHPYVTASLDYLAECQLALQCYENSLHNFKLSLCFRYAIYPRNHPEIAQSYIKLGQYYETLKDFGLSLDYYQKAFEIIKENDKYSNKMLELAKQKLIQLNKH